MTMLLLSAIGTACHKEQPAGAQPKPADAGNQAPAPARPTVALVLKTLTNPFWVIVEQGGRRAEKELDINLIVKTGAKETSVQQQAAIVEQLIRDRVDAIVIAPVSSVDLIPVLVQAKQAGIIMITVDEPVHAEAARAQGLGELPLITVDNEQGGYLAAQYLSRRITVPAEVAIVEGIRSSETAEQRKRGALRAFAENKNIRVVAMESANWKIEEARAVAERMFAAHPGIQAVFCANDMMALGVIRYLEESGKTDVLVTGYDDLEEAREAIRRGKLLVTVNQQADMQGYMGVHAAWRALKGEKLPERTFVDVKLVTAETLK